MGGCGAGSEHKEDCLGGGVHSVMGKDVCITRVIAGEDGALVKIMTAVDDDKL